MSNVFIGAITSKKEIEEMRKFLKSGGSLRNDRAGYLIFIAKDGTRYFSINDKDKFFKNEDAFLRAAIRTVKRGYCK